jgi:hypothetical protein
MMLTDLGHAPGEQIVPDTIAERKAAMAKFVRASMEGWVSYLKDPAPGNALIVPQPWLAASPPSIR